MGARGPLNKRRERKNKTLKTGRRRKTKHKAKQKGKLNEYYFVHSYFFDCEYKKNIIGETDYGINFTSFVSKENIYGVQFHPEKSSKQGMELIKNFLKL